MKSASTPMLPTDIIEFYLTKSPHAHSDKGCSAQSIDLSAYGWEKNHLDTLMKWVAAKHLNPQHNEAAISFTIAKEIRHADYSSLQEKFEHSDPSGLGGLFCISQKVITDTSNSITCKLTETYATCFFRHIRNSIAHGSYQINSEGTLVLFRDQSSKIGTPDAAATAVLLTNLSVLEELIITIEAGPNPIDKSIISSAPPYRVSRKVEALIEPTHEN